MDERAFIATVEAAEPDQFARILAFADAEQEQALRVYFGDERFQRLQGMAVRQRSRTRGEKAGHVIVIPGIMGSELTSVGRDGDLDRIWLYLPRLIFGRVDRLRLADDGIAEWNPRYETRPTGVLKRYYGEVLLALNENWNVRAFWFDWRKSLSVAAAQLNAQLTGWVADDKPVHIVAHSMGGLVARTFILEHKQRWNELRGRLVMLGTPNHGSFAIPQVLTGAESTIRRLERADIFHDHAEVMTILNSFVGTYQMLPSPELLPQVKRLYEIDTWGRWNVSSRHLETSLRHHKALKSIVDVERMTYIAGYDVPTLSDITDFSRLDDHTAYAKTLDGDGRVPHALGALSDKQGKSVPMYFVAESHGALPGNRQVQAAIEDLLASGTTGVLLRNVPRRGGDIDAEAAYTDLLEREAAEERQLDNAVEQIQSRGMAGRPDPFARDRYAIQGWRGNGASRPDRELSPAPVISHYERDAADLLVSGILTGAGQPVPRDGRGTLERISIKVGLVCAGIELVGTDAYQDETSDSIDAIAVGHYVGVRPVAAELAIDEEISRVLNGGSLSDDSTLVRDDLILTQFSDRGILRGDLGQPFFMLDPRVGSGQPGHAGRVIAIAGMGVPGRFGSPELSVMVRELCWSLGRMGKQHLAATLIGAGTGNLSIEDTIAAWFRGIESALASATDADEQRILRVTFVHYRRETVEIIRKAILDKKERQHGLGRLDLTFAPASDEAMSRGSASAEQRMAQRRNKDAGRRPAELPPTRITVTFDDGVYHVGAITETAAVPERRVPLDPKLVAKANAELATQRDLYQQFERGLFLQHLLLPRDLRDQLRGAAPVVMMLDASTAAIHWEMLAQPDPLHEVDGPLYHSGLLGPAADGSGPAVTPKDFLGTHRGFTRQLRTTFAPPPEPPPPPRRVLRVLVVADPAADAPLPGADREGIEIADLFETFNTVVAQSGENRVEVVRLIGPHEATRTNVLRHTVLHRFDVLHFAGHCFYNRENPSASGWIFSNGETLTANELSRIDRIPKFVFSNACESGVLPDRPEMRSVELAPSFAEVFFARGVANFVCTAWPIDDTAARTFAIVLYARLLGLDIAGPADDSRGSSSVRPQRTPVQLAARGPQPMHIAMQEARLAIAETMGGVRTWGAYQHYGNPYLRLFDPRALSGPASAATPAASTIDVEEVATPDVAEEPIPARRRRSSVAKGPADDDPATEADD